MDEDACRRALATLDPPYSPVRVTPIEGGWSFWTFAADDTIVRFPRTPNDARLLQREFDVLPAIAGRLAVPVPNYHSIGTWAGWPFGVYKRLSGHPASAEELLANGGGLAFELGQVLRALHDIPAAEFGPANVQDAGDTWWDRKLVFFDECRARAFPLLDPSARTVAEREIARIAMRVNAGEIIPTFAHNDLGLVHILTDGRKLTGIIDWSDAEVTDPAIDFVGILASGGGEALDAVLEGYGARPGLAFEERLWFLMWISPLHDILYGLDTGAEEILADGIAGVSKRMRQANLIE